MKSLAAFSFAHVITSAASSFLNVNKESKFSWTKANIPACLQGHSGVFDPTSRLVQYIDQRGCGPRGADANPELSICGNLGFCLVHHEPLGYNDPETGYPIVHTDSNGCNYYEYRIFDCHSAAPSASPSLLPSIPPSDWPSLLPSIPPSSIPSEEPSDFPSFEPSSSPSVVPSSIPSSTPTDIPSSEPSIEPTFEPSIEPSFHPSLLPSIPPSDFPSSEPSIEPTFEPSIDPSFAPTEIPSIPPSDAPTLEPSVVPSYRPTASDPPSNEPSVFPSFRPTMSDPPSEEPSISPTFEPSIEPSYHPSILPSIPPSEIPTVEPSDEPSFEPSISPTFVPSISPSDVPSSLPSEEPSDFPSFEPSHHPSLLPSIPPSEFPSIEPSLAPSKIHSVNPSSLPTAIPSEEPSDIPSFEPSHHPSLLPSIPPSDFPSSLPSDEPSDIPSFEPSHHPSLLPSIPPSDFPSAMPSYSPSSIPSFSPTAAPSLMPSSMPSSSPSSAPSSQPSLAPSSLPTTELRPCGYADLPFDSSSPLTAYFDVGDCGLRGDDAKGDFSVCGGMPECLVKHVKRNPYDPFTGYVPVITDSNSCQYLEYWIYDCQTHKPSQTPSFIESANPSSMPSKLSSSTPTSLPSIIPSMAPSTIPSSSPSSIPSALPTLMPSLMPSFSPTSLPSSIPSDIPSTDPSSIPSESPSSLPSSIPSSNPSALPTLMPSLMPSYSPTSLPSSMPSDIPSTYPSSIPSSLPSSSPSSIPSSIPSSSPSDIPSTFPSSLPSSIPSSSPSSMPSMFPASLPSSLPSSSPSSIPSSIPSSLPSSIPSSLPSSIPSSIPSSSPSDIPSSIPSSFPSDIPSTFPSSLPSSIPSSLPSSAPTNMPSSIPSDPNRPSTFPSIPPSIKPSQRDCPPVTKVCNDVRGAESLFPMNGPRVGGTVIRISRTYLCTERNSIHCKFENSETSVVTEAYKLDKDTVECVSPPSNGPDEIQLSIAMFTRGCGYEEAEARWNQISTSFTYDTDTPGVLAVPVDLAEGTEHTRLFYSQARYEVEFNPDAIKLVSDTTGTDFKALSIDLTVNKLTMRNKKVDLNELQRFPIDTSTFDTGKFRFNIIDVTKVTYVTVNIEVYQVDERSLKRVRAMKSSNIIGVVPIVPSSEFAPVEYCSDPKPNKCSDVSDVPACPTDFGVGENDPDFEEDDTCEWDSLAGCTDRSNLLVDLEYDCANGSDKVRYGQFCKDITPVTNSTCNCKYFKGGKAPLEDPDAIDKCDRDPSACKWIAGGCLKDVSGISQCCYTQRKSLIQTVTSGGGRQLCNSTSDLDNFSYDMLPYLYCCKGTNFGDLCDAHNTNRPAITAEGYEPPPIPSQCFGDPHLESHDKKQFDFNGYGEFVFFCGKIGSNPESNLVTCKPDTDKTLSRLGTTAVHYRLARLEENHNGTVVVGLAVEDPSFKRGEEALTVVTHFQERMRVFSNGKIVGFGRSVRGKKRKAAYGGAKMELSPDASDSDYNLRITLASGLIIRVRETGGVLTIGFLRRSKKSEGHVGVMGIPDGIPENDFLTADGTKFDETEYTDISSRYEALFKEFGSSWMVPSKEHSLFRHLTGTNDFANFHFPTYIPNFDGVDPSEGCDLDICQPFTGFLKASCCFDYTVTGDLRLVSGVMNEAQKEKDVQIIINNTAPVLDGLDNVELAADIGEPAAHVVHINDIDGDAIIAIMERSDRDLFIIQGYGSSFKIIFIGTEKPGRYEVEVLFTDQVAFVKFRMLVHVRIPACRNVQSFSKTYKETLRKCHTIHGDSGRLNKMCNKYFDVRKNCQMTCGLCTEDDPEFRFKDDNNFRQSCKWLSKKSSRKNKYCTNLKTKSYCPVTCDFGKEKYECKNYLNFEYKTKSCAAIMAGSRESRNELCGYKSVYENCPVTCGVCCEDDKRYQVQKIRFGKKSKKRDMVDCAWIGERESRVKNYCTNENTAASCAFTCGKCLPFVEPKRKWYN